MKVNTMEKWEYIVVNYMSTSGAEKLNELGQSGWELVSVVIDQQRTSDFLGSSTTTDTQHVTYFLKRKVDISQES